MLATIHQPNYLPWLGYFHKMAQSDVLVLLDTVQYSKNSFQNRNKVKTHQGGVWLTVPVLTKGKPFQPTNAVLINNVEPWASRHLRTIRDSYARAPHLNDYLPELAAVYQQQWERLADLNEKLIRLIAKWLGIRTEVVKASELGVSGESTGLLIGLCQAVKADRYLSGPSGRSYLDESLFANAGIELQYHQFTHPVYRQLHGDFEPNLSALDLLLNHGEDSARLLAGEEL